MDAKALVLATFQAAIVGTVFCYGLQARWDDLLYLVRRPALLLRSMLAVLVIMPIVVVICMKYLDLPHPTAVVLTALSISPVPPMLPRKHAKAGGIGAYGLGLLLVLGLGSIVTVPAWVAVLERVFGIPLATEPGAIAKVMLTMVIAPLVVGILCSRLMPRISHALLKPVRAVAFLLLIAGALALLAGTWRAILSATGHGTVMAILVFVLLGLLVGHLLGGPTEEEASALALSTASRHPAISLAIASANFPGEQFLPTLALYLLICTLAVLPYVKWQVRRAARDGDSLYNG